MNRNNNINKVKLTGDICFFFIFLTFYLFIIYLGPVMWINIQCICMYVQQCNWGEKGKAKVVGGFQRAFWSSLSFQLRQRMRLWNQSPVWSNLFTVGSGCWLMYIRTECPRDSCCLLFPSKETHALLRASSGICAPIIIHSHTPTINHFHLNPSNPNLYRKNPVSKLLHL